MPSMIFESLEESVAAIMEAKNKGLHKTLSGKFVKIGSHECGKDIQARISDIAHHRDMSPQRSDARIYYTGLLRVLGRQLRENDRIMSAASNEKANEPKSSKNKLRESAHRQEEKLGSRILKLAGIL